jgi:hypothetical protein
VCHVTQKEQNEIIAEPTVRFHASSIDSSFHIGVMNIKLNNYFALL